MLTREQIEQMPAGREMDALVAELVMGWKFIAPKHGWCCTCQNCGRAYDDCNGGCEYSADIAAAWAVVERLNVSRLNVYLTAMADGDCEVMVSTCHDDELHAEGSTITEAICRCALLATLRPDA